MINKKKDCHFHNVLCLSEPKGIDLEMKFTFWQKSIYKYIVLLILINTWFSEMPGLENLYFQIKPIVLALIVFCLFAEAILNKYNSYQIIVTTLLLSIGIFTYLRSDSLWPFYCMVMISFANNIEMKCFISLIKRFIGMMLVSNFIIFTIRYVFFPDSLEIITSRNLMRYDINFSSPNEAAKMLIIYVLLLFMSQKKNIPYKLWIGIFLIAIIFYHLTYSDSLICLAVIFLFDQLKKNKKIRSLTKILGRWCLPFGGFISIIMVSFHPNFITATINELSTGRVSLIKNCLEYYGVSLWGQSVALPGWKIMKDGTSKLLVCDNTYWNIIIHYGAIYILLLLILVVVVSKYLTYELSVSLIMFTFLALVYDSMLSPLSVFPLVLSYMIYIHNRHIKKRNIISV